MGWETRGTNGPYYTRSYRRNGRVVREYVGGGLIGELAAELDELKRLERQEKSGELREQIRGGVTDDKLCRDFCDAVEALARAELYLAGYHRHERSQWRKRRAEHNQS